MALLYFELHYWENFGALRGSRVVGVAAPLTSRREGLARVLLTAQQALAPASGARADLTFELASVLHDASSAN